jgi:hypothetical protein
MAKPEKNIWEELEERIRRWIKDLDDALIPKQPKRARVPVPVRVRPEDQQPR